MKLGRQVKEEREGTKEKHAGNWAGERGNKREACWELGRRERE